MEVEERPGELDGKLTKDIKDSILFWRKDKSHGISKLQGLPFSSFLSSSWSHRCRADLSPLVEHIRRQKLRNS